MIESNPEYWQQFDPTWRGRAPAYDRTMLRDPASRKDLAGAAATVGTLAPGVDALERGVLMLRQGNVAGRQALVDGFRWIIEAMDRHGYVDIDEEETPTSEEVASAAKSAEVAVRRFRQGYEKAALGALHDAINLLGRRVVL
jgi:hypothetical protein